MNSVQIFSYRQPRFRLQLPCDFATETDVVEGHTVDLSEHGLRVVFRHPVRGGSRGRLRLKMVSCWFEAEAEIVYSELESAGVSFLFASEAERRFLQSIVRLVARDQQRRNVSTASSDNQFS